MVCGLTRNSRSHNLLIARPERNSGATKRISTCRRGQDPPRSACRCASRGGGEIYHLALRLAFATMYARTSIAFQSRSRHTDGEQSPSSHLQPLPREPYVECPKDARPSRPAHATATRSPRGPAETQ